MRHRHGLIVALFTCCATLVACGGGGGGGASVAPPAGGGSTTPTSAPGSGATPTAKPTATATGVAVSLPSSNPANPSQITVNSNPAGLTVTVDGTAAGVTPATPAAGFGAHTIVVTPQTTASPYAVKLSNTGNAAISVFYNQTADSAGKIGSGIATSSVSSGGPPVPLLTLRGVRMPATTSSPCAFGSHSPIKRRSPVDGSRVKQTPVALDSPRLPKTIACTLHAVPQALGMSCMRLYVIARWLFQLEKTALIAPQS